jgi:protease IV
VLQLPDTESREQETFRARERSDGGRLAHSVFLDLPGTATARFRSSRPARFLAQREVTDVVHGFPKSTLRASGGKGVREDGEWRIEDRGWKGSVGKSLVRLTVLRKFPPVMAANRKLGCLSIFLFVALCASLFANFVFAVMAISRLSGSSRQEEAPPRFREVIVQRGNNDKIAVITMRGLISSSLPGNVGDSMVDDMRAALQQARDDDNVRAVVLEIDSPGGEVTASDVIYNLVVKTRAKKPVVVYMDSLAASGGYYVACGGKYLMANETTITGSIGVIIQTLNYEQLFNKIGLASVVFKSGKFKDMLNGARPITPEERDYVQSFVMKTYDKFLGIVAKERNVPADVLRNTVADGRILSGKDALDNKLIDGLGQIEDAFAKAKELGNARGATIVKYGPPFSWSRVFRAFSSVGDSKIELTLPKQLVPQLESGRAYFLPSFYAP